MCSGHGSCSKLKAAALEKENEELKEKLDKAEQKLVYVTRLCNNLKDKALEIVEILDN